MGQSVLDGLLLVLQPESLLYLTIGMAIGLVIGFLPGLGGLATLALLTPLIIGMDPAPGLSFILGAYGAVSFGGSITAILFNVPGTGEQVVTTFDGYPMAKKGQAGRALGVSAAASAFGGIFGVIVLVLAIPIALQLMTYIRSPEIFALGLLGILVIGISDADTRLKGIISGALGLMLSFIGLDPVTGIARMTFGNLELTDGLGITAITMGLFALSEMFAIYTKGVAIAGNVPASRSREKGSRVIDGVMDGVRNWKMVLQGGSIGALSGVVPGVGGTIGMFGAYAMAKKTSKDPSSFGKGNPVGVLAPESANNAKEGGSFVPTLAFGVPGSSGMALVIVILLIMGFVPGPDMVNNHLDIVFLIAWVMALSNILCSVMGIGLAPALAKLAFLRPALLAPALIAVSLIGSFLDTRLAMSIVVALVFGFVGYLFKATGYSAAGITLGFVLGPLIDQNLALALQVFGPTFLLRPIPIVLGALVVLAVTWPYLKRLLFGRKRPPSPPGPDTSLQQTEPESAEQTGSVTR
jgi:TctA family transporter